MKRTSTDVDAELELGDGASGDRGLLASRARLVAGTYAEQRRVERELHDGVQQHLVALAVNIQIARELADADPPALAALLDEMARDVSDALGGVRELAQEIYPSLLLDRGLTDAIGAAASASAVRTRVEAAALRRYPEDLEATVYYCCVDALRGAVVRGAGDATIRIWEEGAILRFDVTDDSAADAERQDGTSVSSIDPMRDRVGAVGGRLSVASRPGGGTRVSGLVPLDA